MRSARMILATAAASAALAIGAPGAYAAGDTDHDDSSYSKEDTSSYSTDHDSQEDSTAKEEDSTAKEDHAKEDHGKEDHGKEEHGKEEKEEHGKEHGKPSGGMHTGGGALALTGDSGDRGAAKDPRFDPETYKDKDSSGGHGNDSWNGGHEESEGGWSKEHDKPSGGMHTGGGALATPTTTAAGLGILAVAGTGLYALRRKKTVGGVA
ncbi:hypothetical protein [Streptomyces asoensis]|uniref:Gram-positive cocci surface proteins LPxTG domain-containing protein n=1 Tax=Streptomyces asoensis TaxID=249586 RepID=A0ABQ3RVM3_9ACTN|nr:hypothetical protein [Streptomyces asoensis]GHI59868.1 hypothetical protein Saso_15180 [Streptomyces asoensis]